MSDSNFAQQAGDFTLDAATDTTADRVVNRAIDAVGSPISGGNIFEQMVETEVERVLNNDINTKLNKGTDAMLSDAARFFFNR
jgi:hypothetical protein